MILYSLLLLLYATIPPVVIFFLLKLVYRDKNKYGAHLFYAAEYLFTLSFLPLLFLSNLKLGIVPQNKFSLLFLVLTFLLAAAGIFRAVKMKKVFFYLAGVHAAFMEEILYRAIIFSLALVIFKNQWVALAISSILFGTWHLKNYYWVGGKNIIIQFLYTALVYGPIFGLMRIFTGDIYLAVLFHFITDASCALSPDWLRGWLVLGGKGKLFDDKTIGLA